MKSLGDILTDLQDILFFWRGRSRAWKALAKRYRDMHAFNVANPGLAMARHIVDLHTEERTRPEIIEMLGIQACETMGWAFAEYLQNHPEAPNYLEVTLSGGEQKPLYVTIQRPGGKSPNQLRLETQGKLYFCEDANKEALKLRDELLDQIEKLKEDNESLENRNRVLAAEVADGILTAQDRDGVASGLTRKLKEKK